MSRSNQYKTLLFVVFILIWIWAAIHPYNRHDWLLENYLIFISVPLILILGKYFKLTNTSYTLMAIFLVLHVIGSHYTYAEVPFGYSLQHWFDYNRNTYDRLVHFCFGLLISFPVREVFIKLSNTKGFWSYYFPLDLVITSSAVYEIMEWLVASVVDPAAGLAFLGIQGDVWDTQKDMLVAAVGAAIAMLIIFIANTVFNENRTENWKEFKDSFKIANGHK